MARTDTLGNFLTDVADAIRAKAGTSDTIQASSFDTAISNIPSGGKTDGMPKFGGIRCVAKDNANTITIACPSIANDNATYQLNNNEITYPYSLNGLVTNVNNNSNINSRGIVIAMVRSDYTLSENLELIAQSEWFEYADTSQKLLILWCEGNSATITTTQSGRITLQYIYLINAKKPTSNNVILNIIESATSLYTVSPTNDFCIYAQSSVGYNHATLSNYNADVVAIWDRMGSFISMDNQVKTCMLLNGQPNAVIGIKIEYEAE